VRRPQNFEKTFHLNLENIGKIAYVLYGRPQNFWQEKPIFSPSFLVPFTARKISTIASQTKQFLSSVKFKHCEKAK
jgi:hypothetical protein